MQLSKLWIAKVVTENNSNGPSISGLLQDKDQNQRQTAVIPNDNHEFLQPLRYHTYHDNGDGEGACPISIKDLRNNDKKILSLLNEEMGSTYSFKSLERKLDIHQQSLTRALKRLKELGLVERTPTGYRPIKNKCKFFPDTIDDNSQFGEEEEEDARQLTSEAKKTRKRFNQLIQISIPIRNNIEAIINQLVGKWFGSLRWFGLVKKDTGVTLQWIAIDRYNGNKLFQINVNIVSEYVVIESNAVSDKEKVEAMSCSNRIVGQIIKTVQSNLQEGYEIPGELATPNGYAPPYSNKVKYNYKKDK